MSDKKEYKLTLQTFLKHQWIDIAELVFNEDYKLIDFYYLSDYVLSCFGERGVTAVSINYPVDFFTEKDELNKHWLAFLNDIIPAGALHIFSYFFETY